MFIYCGNNPISGYDPSGKWDWGVFGQALSIILVGVCAIATVATAGCAAPALAASIAIASGAAAITIGVVEIHEAATDHNMIVEDMLGGNETAYLILRSTVTIAASISAVAVNMAAANANSLTQCFAAGTLVLTSTGSKAIESIHAGNFVWAENPETGECALKQVLQTFVNETNELVYLKINGEEIATTPEHPFYVPSKGWTGAIHLRAGVVLCQDLVQIKMRNFIPS